MLDKLIREAHNRERIWGEGQPLRSRSTRVFSAVAHPSSQLLTVRDAYFADRRWHMFDLFWNKCLDDEGQDIAEYAVMLAVILVLVVGTIRLVGSNANNVFSSVASSVH
jgi:Flp pilus assembly pilin Flp